MKNTLVLVTLLLTFSINSLATTANKIITCPTVKAANEAFLHCKININKTSCHASLENTEWVLDSPVEEIYGGEHQFGGFVRFEAVEILSNSVVCKYTSLPATQKMGWIIGSRYEAGKNCHLSNAKYVLGISNCKEKNPQKCKIICD